MYYKVRPFGPTGAKRNNADRGGGSSNDDTFHSPKQNMAIMIIKLGMVNGNLKTLGDNDTNIFLQVHRRLSKP